MQNIDLSDTIAAISTPIGQGGIGIIRLSGKDALRIADGIFVSKDGEKPSSYKTYSVHYGYIVNQLTSFPVRQLENNKPRTEIIDEVLLTVMRAPKSYTKEDIVEISCHSGILILKKIMDLVLSKGARLAYRGEFTKRAFLNGRIDLSKAEAVLDIINAKTDLALESGIKHLQGKLQDEIVELRESILEAIVILEANIDFPEEQIKGVDRKKINRIIDSAAKRIDGLLNLAQHGKILREGINAAIVGRANVGKSSLLNALLKEERAIVTPIPGTTRDSIEEILDLKGIPLKITDTAGIIEPRDLVEKEALKRAQGCFERADLILLVFDSNLRLTKEDRLLINKAKKKTTIAVLNKSDLKKTIEEEEVRKHFAALVNVSSLKQIGIRDLEEKILQLVWNGKLEATDELIVSNVRHIRALRCAKESLKKAKDSLLSGLSIEFVAEDLKISSQELGYITGESLIGQDLLDKIFNEFCIGK